MKTVVLIGTHLGSLALGFALGVYLLPILIAPPAPDINAVQAASKNASYTTEFVRDLSGSDLLHWGEGKVSVGRQQITLMGEVAPGPAYKLYLTNKLATNEAEFLAIKDDAVLVGSVLTFNNFVVSVPASIDVQKYKAVVIWCEAFSEFITAGAYQ
jgi:hypothetical protein